MGLGTSKPSSAIVNKLRSYYLLRSIKQERKQILRFYLAGDCSTDANYWHRQPLESLDNQHGAIEIFLNSPDQFLSLILGDAGVGKSALTLRLIDYFCEKSTDTTYPGFIPIRIELKTFDQQSVKNCVQHALAEQFELSAEEINELRKMSDVVFLLDGYDEIAGHARIDIYRENKLDTKWPKVKVLITCRNQHFKDEEDCRRLFHLSSVKHSFYQQQLSTCVPDLLYLAPFDTNQIERYLEQFAAISQANLLTLVKKPASNIADSAADLAAFDLAKAKSLLKEYPHLKEVLQIPLVLQIFAETLPSLLKRYGHDIGNIVMSDIYKQFLDDWFNHAEERLEASVGYANLHENILDLKTCFYNYAQNFAFSLFAEDKVEITYTPLNRNDKFEIRKQTGHQAFKHFFESSDGNQEEQKELDAKKAACPLRRSSKNEYSFIHKSFQDYLAAKYLFALLQDRYQGIKDLTDKNAFSVIIANLHHPQHNNLLELLNAWNKRFLTEDRQVLQFLAELLNKLPFAEREGLVEKIMRPMVQHSAQDKNYEIAASSIMSCLAAAKVTMSGWNLSGVSIPNAELSGAILHRTNLTRANLTGVIFFKAYLVETDFSGSEMKEVQLGELPYIKYDDPISCLSFSLDGLKLAVGQENKIVITEASTGKQLQLLQRCTREVYAVTWSPDGKILASGGFTIVQLWDVESGKNLRILRGHTYAVKSVAWSRDGKTLASGGIKSVRLWDIESGKVLQILQVDRGEVRSLTWSPDGKMLAFGSSYESVLWDVETGKVSVLQVDSGEVNSVAWSPDGKTLAFGTRDKSVKLWDVKSGKDLHILQGHTSVVNSVSWSSDGKVLALASSDSSVWLWDVGIGKIIQVLRGHTAPVRSVSWSSHGKMLASGSEDRSVRVWDINSGKAMQVLQWYSSSICDIVCSSDGTKLASVSHDDSLRFWDAKTGKALQMSLFDCKWVPNEYWRPNDKILISKGVEKHKAVQVLQRKSYSVTIVDFSPDGKQMASGSADKTIRLWDAVTYKCLSVIPNGAPVRSINFYSQSQLISGDGAPSNALRLWECRDNQWYLKWSSPQQSLCMVGCVIEGVNDLSDQNRRLIEQRSSEIKLLPPNPSKTLPITIDDQQQKDLRATDSIGIDSIGKIMRDPLLVPIKDKSLKTDDKKDKLVELLFNGILKKLSDKNLITLSPKIFLVYAHDNAKLPEKLADGEIAKLFITWLQKDLRLNLYSDITPLGHQETSQTINDIQRKTDILKSQLCLLPKTESSVDTIILCGSELLKAYCDLKKYEIYYTALNNALSRGKAGAEYASIQGIVNQSSREQDFHHVFTELVFLNKRILEDGQHTVIPVMLNGTNFSEVFPHFIAGTDVYIEKTKYRKHSILNGKEVYKNEGLYIGFFELLERLFEGKEIQKEIVFFKDQFINKIELIRSNKLAKDKIEVTFRELMKEIEEAEKEQLSELEDLFSTGLKKIKDSRVSLVSMESAKICEKSIVLASSIESSSKLPKIAGVPLSAPVNPALTFAEEVKNDSGTKTNNSINNLVIEHNYNKINPSQTEKSFSEPLKITEKLHKHYQSRISNDYELSQALNYYVSAECIYKEDAKNSNLRHDLHNDVVLPHIQNTSTQRSPLLLLQGDSGSGKSLYVNWLEKKLWDTCSDISSPIPILIELRNFKPREKRIKNINLLENHLRFIGYSDDEILKLRTDFHTVIILDGFDEISEENDNLRAYDSQSIRIPDNLYLANQLHNWKAHVIITCRTQYLRNHRNYADWFVYKPGVSIKEAEITPFHQKQIERYLTVYAQHTPPPAEWGISYLEIIKGLNGAFELISNPLILFMALRSLKTLMQRQAQSEVHSTPDTITRTTIYEAFIQEWFDREVQRTINSSLNIRSKDLRMSFYKYCMRLAFKMHLRGLISVTYYPISHECIDEYALEPTYEQLTETKQWEEFFSTTDPQIIQIRSGCPLRLTRIQNNLIYTDIYEYTFYHRSFLEYFAARHLYLTLHLDNTESSITQRVILDLEKKPINEKLLKSEPGITEFFAQMVQYQSRKLDRLLSIVLASRNNPGVCKAASNALTLLTKAHFSFSNLDLSRINAPDAVLDDMIADTTNFQDADLTGASLSQAWMRKSVLRNCQLSAVQFGERPYLEYQENVHCISASHDGRLVAVGIERSISLWDVESMSLLKTLEGHAGRYVVISVALSRDGQLLVSGSEDIRIWNTSTGKCVKILTEHVDVQCLSLSTNEKLLASGSSDKTVRIWEISSGSCIQILKGHEGGITCVSISANGERIYSGSYDRTIRIWDVSTASETCKIECSSSINSLAVISDKQRYVAATTDHDNFVSIWNANTGQCERTLKGHTSNLTAVSVDAEAEQLAAGGWDKTIWVWDLSTGQCKKIIKGNPANHIHRLHLTANGKRLFSISRMSDDRTVRIWDLPPKNTSQIDNNTSLESSIHLSSDGKLLASGTMGGVIRIWNIASGQCVYTLTGHTKPVFTVIFSNDSNLLASADQQSIRIWNLSNYQCIQTIQSKHTSLNTISLKTDTKQLASGDNSGIIQIWDIVTGQCKRVLYGHEGFVATLALCRDGERLVSGGKDRTVRIWNIEKGKCDILHTHNGIVDSISLSTDNRCLASADRESEVRLWDLDTYICLRIINLHSYSHEFLNEDGSSRVVSRSNGSITFTLISSENYPDPFSFTQTRAPHLRTFSKAGGGAICLPLSTAHFNYVSLNSNGTHLVTASGEKVSIWKIADGKNIAAFSTSSDIRRIDYYYPDSIAVCCEVSSLQLWQRVREKNHWYLAWSGHSRPLVLTDCQINNRTFESLSFINRMLLKQRKVLIDGGTQVSEQASNPASSDLEESDDQVIINNLPSSKVSGAAIMAKRGSSLFAAVPIASQNVNPSKMLVPTEEVLPDWLTGDHISQISDAMLKSSMWRNLNRLIEFSPTIDLHADDLLAGSLKNTLDKKMQELQQETPTPIFSFALNLSPNTNATTGRGCHWIYGMIIHKSNKNKIILINSLNENNYQMSLVKVKSILQTRYKIMDADIKFISTGYQNDAFNCGIWTLVLLERTLESLNIHRDKFIDFSLKEIEKQLLLGSQVNLNQFINQKRKEYDRIYSIHIKKQENLIPQLTKMIK